MSVSIGVVPNAQRTFTDAMQVSNRAAEMKKYAKGQQGSCYRVDRRTAGAAAGEGEVGPVPGAGGGEDGQGVAGRGR